MSVWFRQSLIIIFYWIYHFIGVILYYSLFNLWHSAKMRNLFLTRYVGDMQLRKPKLHSFFSLSFLKKKKKKNCLKATKKTFLNWVQFTTVGAFKTHLIL